MTRRYAADTSVSTDKSIAEIRATLRRYGAKEFMHVEGEHEAAVVFVMNDRRVMFRLQMPDPADWEFTHTPTKNALRTADAALAAWEQACRSRWRALALVVKAKLEAVAVGIVTFEDEFLANIVMPDGALVSEHVRPRIASAYEHNEMQPLLPNYSKGGDG
ncbi:hypothetical protein ACUSIJ_17785 [Pseudochelatococcus sp. B33]